MNFKQNKLSSAKPEIQLREKEIELLKWSCTELTYKEIAAKMNLSPKTIDGYRESIFEKLELHSRVGMAVYAIRHGIFKI
jgi:DNA-binding CsgD family transcriptional regulator